MRSWYVLTYKRHARWRGWGGKWGPLWLHKGALTFKSPQQSRTPQYA